MKIVRVYTGSDGLSHFEDIDFPMKAEGGGLNSEPIKVVSISLRETDGSFKHSMHNASKRQLVVPLVGKLEQENSDGTVRRIGPGTIMLEEDLTGKGHASRDSDGKPRKAIRIVLAEGELANISKKKK